MSRFRCLLVVLIGACVVGCTNDGGNDEKTTEPSAKSESRPKVAFVTNGIANFWVIAKAGANAAGESFDCDVEVKMPAAEGGRAANQKRILEELLSKGVDGIAVSPVDPDNQQDILNTVGENCHYITHDSDAPKSNRLVYIGMNNYDAGRMCGQLVKEAIPDGGDVVLFIGSQDQLNSRLRRQGVIDELLDRSHDPSRYDATDADLKGDKYSILDTRVDDFDQNQAKALPEDALVKYPDVDCMVGLFEYNPPAIFEALKNAGKLGQIKVVGFDENENTLQAILDGNCIGTVVQDPYNYGHRSVEVLAALTRGEKGVIPADGFIDIPARKITKSNAQEFWDNLKSLVGQ